jgi:hypothetical protein
MSSYRIVAPQGTLPPSPGGGGLAHIERSEDVRRGGVIVRRTQRPTTSPHPGSLALRPSEPTLPLQGRVKDFPAAALEPHCRLMR